MQFSGDPFDTSMKFLLRILVSLYDRTVCVLGMLVFAAVFLSWSLLALVLRFILPEKIGTALGRAYIMAGFRFCLACLSLSGRFHFDLSELDALRKEKSLIIAGNHPSLWDVVLIISRLPDVACVMKAELVNNLFLGGGARLARYIRNESPRQMITQAVQDLQRGSHLLLFPEGTRTVQAPINPLKGSIAVISSRAGASVQTVFIETESGFLTKEWALMQWPVLPMSYRVRVGRRFAPSRGSAAFIAELEQYFVEELSAAHALTHASSQASSLSSPGAPSTDSEKVPATMLAKAQARAQGNSQDNVQNSALAE
ncbi:N/A [soil metagenome]